MTQNARRALVAGLAIALSSAMLPGVALALSNAPALSVATYRGSYASDDTFDFNGFIFPDSSSRYLSRKEILGVTDSESLSWQLTLLGYARNEIYARHGNKFASDAYSSYYGQFRWYQKLKKHTVATSELNKYEQANVKLIKQIEADLNSYGPFDSNGFIYPDSNSRYLSRKELLNIDDSNTEYTQLELLGFARNEIYARRGHKFTTTTYSRFYGQYSWYKNKKKRNVAWDDFNKYEKANITLIKEIEALWK